MSERSAVVPNPDSRANSASLALAQPASSGQSGTQGSGADGEQGYAQTSGAGLVPPAGPAPAAPMEGAEVPIVVPPGWVPWVAPATDEEAWELEMDPGSEQL